MQSCKKVNRFFAWIDFEYFSFDKKALIFFLKIGPDGEKGDRGMPGIPGANGLAGLRGEIGLQGPEGPMGPQGKEIHTLERLHLIKWRKKISLTHILLLNQGFPGEKGLPGPRGSDGRDGFIGPKGDKGDAALPALPGPSGEFLLWYTWKKMIRCENVIWYYDEIMSWRLYGFHPVVLLLLWTWY